MPNYKKNIALVTGGYSGESVISKKSAEVAMQHIDPFAYRVFTIYVQRDGWFHIDINDIVRSVDKNDFSLNIADEHIEFDAVLMILHGTPGEDGKLQGYFDMLQIPYTTCDASTSALTFNKRYTVATAAFSGISVAHSMHLFAASPRPTVATILSQLALPIFVKPNNGGSSIGMSKVHKSEDLPAAIEKAFREDDQVLLETYIAGREFTVGVMQTQGEIVILPICEIRAKKDFFDFEAKYLGASDEIIPAPIGTGQAETLRQISHKIYQIFNCRGVVRIDFIWNEQDNQPYMLEINTVPGQSAESLVPQMVKAHGWTMREFYTRLIESAQ
jgi:D-alanine-D-alanine ligase